MTRWLSAIVFVTASRLALAAGGDSLEQQLLEAGLPARYAHELATAAASSQPRSAEEIAALARSVGAAYRRGAMSRKLVNLTEDLTRAQVDADLVIEAIDAVGRLAEEGYTDAEARRGVGLSTLRDAGERQKQGGRPHPEPVATDARERQRHDRGEGADADHGQGVKGTDGNDQHHENLRDELRKSKPPNVHGGGPGPAGEKEREEKEKKDKEDKEKAEKDKKDKEEQDKKDKDEKDKDKDKKIKSREDMGR